MWWIIGTGIGGLFVFLIWCVLALGDKKDDEMHRDFIEIMKIKNKTVENTITSGCPVENNK